MRGHKPILGFGPIGWLAAAVLVALLFAVMSGIDVQEKYLELIAMLVGGQGLLWYMGHVHVWHGLALTDPQFSTVSILYVIVAFRIAPYKLRWWRYAIIVACGLIGPLVYVHLPMGFQTLPFLGITTGTVRTPLIFYGAIQLVICGVLGLFCRSWRVFFVCAAATVVAHILHAQVFLTSRGGSPYEKMIGPAWHIAMASTLLWWAIRARQSFKPEGHCERCGYDLRGAAHERCPECGAHCAHRAQSP